MFNWFNKNTYKVNDTVITYNGFIGKIETTKTKEVGYETYVNQYLIYCTEIFSDNTDKYKWFDEYEIAYKLNSAQKSLFSSIFRKIRDLNYEIQYKDKIIDNLYMDFHRRLKTLEQSKEEAK